MSRANQIIEEIETTVQQEIDPEAVKSSLASVLPTGWVAQEVKLTEKGEVVITFQNSDTQESIETLWTVGQDKTPMVGVTGTDLAVDLSNFNPPTKETSVGLVIDFGADLSWITSTLAQVLLSGAQMKGKPPEEEEPPQQIQTPTQGVGSPEQEPEVIQ